MVLIPLAAATLGQSANDARSSSTRRTTPFVLVVPGADVLHPLANKIAATTQRKRMRPVLPLSFMEGDALADTEIFLVAVVEMAGLPVRRLRAHEVAELEGDGLVVAAASGGFQLQAELVELDGEELDRHVPV